MHKIIEEIEYFLANKNECLICIQLYAMLYRVKKPTHDILQKIPQDRRGIPVEFS